jgi:hypothetical protein
MVRLRAGTSLFFPKKRVLFAILRFVFSVPSVSQWLITNLAPSYRYRRRASYLTSGSA